MNGSVKCVRAFVTWAKHDYIWYLEVVALMNLNLLSYQY